MKVTPELFINALEYSSKEIVEYLIRVCGQYINNPTKANNVLDASLYRASINRNGDLLSYIIANHPSIYPSSPRFINQNIEFTSQVPGPQYSKLSLSEKKILVGLKRVMPITLSSKIKTLKNLSYDELLFFITQEYHTVYQNTQDNQLTQKIMNIVDRMENEQEKIKEIRKIIAFKLKNHNLFYEYFIQYNDISELNNDPGYPYLSAYALYTKNTFNLKGLEFFIFNRSLVFRSYDITEDTVSQETQDFMINPQNKKIIIDFFKLYFSQDFFKAFSFFQECQFLIHSPLISIDLLESCKNIQGFPVNFLITPDPKEIKPLEKQVWYIDFCTEFALRKVGFNDLIQDLICTNEYIDFLYQNKNRIKGVPTFNLDSGELLLYFVSKFESQFPASSYITIKLYQKVIANADLKTLKYIDRFSINFQNSIIFLQKVTWEPIKISSSKESAIEMFNYLLDSKCMGINDKNLFFSVINSLLIKIFNDEDTEKEVCNEVSSVQIKEYDYSIFEKESFDSLLHCILKLHVGAVKYLLDSLVKSNKVDDFIQENSSELIDLKIKKNYMNLNSMESSFYDFKKIVTIIFLLLDNLDKKYHNDFNPVFNILYKYLLFSNCSIEEVKYIKDVLCQSSIVLSITSFHIFHYFNIKSPKLLLYFTKRFISSFQIYPQMKRKFKDDLETVVDSTFAEENFNLEFIANNTFKTLYLMLSSEFTFQSRYSSILDPQFNEMNYLVSIGAYDVISTLLYGCKDVTLLCTDKNGFETYDTITSISNHHLLKSFIEFPDLSSGIFKSALAKSNLEIIQYVLQKYPHIKIDILILERIDYQVLEFILSKNLLTQETAHKVFIIHFEKAIPQAEYDCYKNFVEKFGLKQFYPIDTNGVYPESSFCTYPNSCHNNGSINLFLGRAGNDDTPKTGEKVLINDLECFPYLSEIFVNGIEPSEEFIYYKYPTVSRMTISYKNINQFTQKLPDYDYIYIDTNGPITYIKMSYLNGIKNFFFMSSLAFPTIEVDSGAFKTNLKYFTISASNLPDFSGYQFDRAEINFGNALNPTDILTNFQYLNATNVQFSFKSTVPFYLHLNSYIKAMRHSMGILQTPTQFYDMSNIVNYQSIEMENVGENFLYQNKIPFKVSPTTNLAISFTEANTLQISVELPPVTDVGYLKTARYTNGYLSGNLPEYNGQGSAFIYDNNKLTGTIPESWCGTILSVANNQLTGSIPSCFSCYLGSTAYYTSGISGPNGIAFQSQMYDRFAGSSNTFTNYDKTIPCTTYKPQVKYHNQTTFIISGIDIGLIEYYYIGSVSPGNQCRFVPDAVIRFGYEYYCNQFLNLQRGNYFTLFNIGNNLNYNFALVSKPPTFTSIITTENNKVSAVGTFFSSYIGQSVQTITIGGTDCQVTNTGFTNFTCITSVTLSSEKQLVVIKNDNQTKKVFAVFENNRLNNKQCPNDCVGSLSGDVCDLSTGHCECDIGLGGEKCEFSQHYITSVNPSNENGGEASFYGSFGEQHNQLSVTIGSKTCPVTHSSNNLISCTAPPGKGIHSVNITQNNIVYIGKDIYIYSKVPQNIFECPKNCSSHGKCNTSNGNCECYLGYTSFDCGSIIESGNKDNTTSNVDNSTGIVDIQNEKINFKIYLKSLNEIDINNNIVKSYPLVSDWTVNKTQSNIYTFKQSPNQDEFNVISTIEQIENDKTVSFAGIDFLLTNNSIKFTVSIKNYKYLSFLNTLQLEMESNTTELTNDRCNNKETQLDTESLNSQYDLSYIKLSKNNIDFVGRFVNKVVSDSKPTFFTTSYTKLDDSVTITLHLPHCVNECLIDPGIY
ncbi:hypothetical protein DICPUDRAFT_149585 [Dictyostelium purpureum]|uniref:EGF-like domain-containing protein n=1 Tax=Dictyostelium purpureum TaxID=5786 RepID=F0ZE70_DICPU|nr:uncharacterized protein DICPUDRAFT_149585 [Dictyostelium purpureum]EGC37773.1 hypothetical protein DICPUDRAFT_149585 [Dictyostelium purpureum]|eukprot:XP_003285712.1 hypothetical protein DICPUDRAFT_149585 [Dictyostelium purpureum]